MSRTESGSAVTPPYVHPDLVQMPIGAGHSGSHRSSRARKSGNGNGVGSGNGNGSGNGISTTSAPSSLVLPTTTVSTSAVLSWHPRNFAPSFDVVDELTANRENYTGSEPLSVYNVPLYLFTCIDRARERVISIQKPSVSCTISCCISYGLSVIAQQHDVKNLLKLKKRLNMVEDVDSADVEELAGFFRSFVVSAADGSASGTRRQQNISMPETIRSAVIDLAGDLGASSSVLAVLAIMTALSIQTFVLEGHQKLLDAAVCLFFKKANLRRRVAEVVLEGILPLPLTSPLTSPLPESKG